jgi:hypothetical protein
MSENTPPAKPAGKGRPGKLHPTIIVAIITAISAAIVALFNSPALVAWIQKDEDPTPVPINRPKPEFLAQVVYPPEQLEQEEYVVAPGASAADASPEYLQVARVAFGQDKKTIVVDVRIKNTGTEPAFLELGQRFFALEDNQGRKAEIVWFCCDSSGDLLPPGREREVQIFFQLDGWYGKSLAMRWLHFRVTGLLPVVRASWKFRPLATKA